MTDASQPASKPVADDGFGAEDSHLKERFRPWRPVMPAPPADEVNRPDPQSQNRIRTAALDRYVRDQALAYQAGRAPRPLPRDVLLLRWIAGVVVTVYYLPRLCLGVIAGGVIWGSPYRHRTHCCMGCTYRHRLHDNGRMAPAVPGSTLGWDYCRAENKGAGCPCPKTRWWPLSTIKWKIRFRWFGCPIGHFGRARTLWSRLRRRATG